MFYCFIYFYRKMYHPEKEVIDVQVQESVEMGILHILEKAVDTFGYLVMVMLDDGIDQIIGRVLMYHFLCL